MVITQFELENFKSFLTRQRLPLAPITLLYGPNGGGKSSVIQALLLLRQSLAHGSGQLIPNGSDVNLGTWSSIVSMQDRSRDITLSVTEPNRLRLHQFSHEHKTVELSYGNSESATSGYVLKSMMMKWDGDYAGQCRVMSTGSEFASPEETARLPFDFDSRFAPIFRLDGKTSLNDLARLAFPHTPTGAHEQLSEALRADEAVRRLEKHYVRCGDSGLPCAFRDTVGGQWDNISLPPDPFDEYLLSNQDNATPPCLMHLGIAYSILQKSNSKLLNALVHIEPLRKSPERIYQRSSEERQKSARYDKPETWTDILCEDPEAMAKCNEWLKRLGTGYSLAIRDIPVNSADAFYQVILDDKSTGASVTLADAGFGISQMLPLLVYPQAGLIGSMICVQQPELHLHPRLQGQLADLFIATACQTSHDSGDVFQPLDPEKGVQWLIETHSEALMTRLQRRVREGKISSSDISVLYVDKIQGRGSIVTPLRLNDVGDFIDEWPGGFFEDGFDDLFGIDR